MEVTRHMGPESLELRVKGRIDATWADNLGSILENAVREGSHWIVLDFADVDYISSLGIGVLFEQYKLLKSVNGRLAISNPNPSCLKVLTMVGLTDLLDKDKPATAGVAAVTAAVQKQTLRGATYEVYPQKVSQPLSCTLIGQPERLASTGFTKEDCRPMSFASGTFGLGLGAFGEDFADCASRFGEFLAAGGCAMALPTGETDALPDFQVEQGGLIPRIETLYALTGSGDFSTMVRFDALAENHGKIGLSELVSSLMDLSAVNSVAFVVLAESAGLVGATLRKSPAGAPVAHELPELREWISFTTERASDKSLCLLVGVAGRGVEGDAAQFLRPIKAKSEISAHMHAAVFHYRPVQRGELPFAKTVADTLRASTPNTILHLMADTRRFEGVGETELSRGACWMGPLHTIARG